jgi:hypothetical protein
MPPYPLVDFAIFGAESDMSLDPQFWFAAIGAAAGLVFILSEARKLYRTRRRRRH